MGIHGLLKTIRASIPQIVSTVSLSDLAGYRVAIDMSIYLYKDIRSAGDNWQEKLVRTILLLKKSGIIPVCIFDGENPPIEKQLTQITRRETTQKTIDNSNLCKAYLSKINKIISDAKRNNEDPEISEELKENIMKVIGANRKKTVFWDDPYSIQEKLRIAIQTYDKQTAPIGDEQRIIAHELIEAMGIPCIRADGEAEALCSYMCVHGNCDAVLSEDSDVLVYGTPIFLSCLDIAHSTVRVIQFQDILNAWAMSRETFVDMCILAGCDYNKDPDDDKPFKIKYKVPGKEKNGYKPCGEKGRYGLFLEGHVSSLEDAIELFLDSNNVEKIKHERIRQIFNEIPDDSMVIAPMSTSINYDFLEKVFKKYHVKINMNHVKDLFSPTKITMKSAFDL